MKRRMAVCVATMGGCAAWASGDIIPDRATLDALLGDAAVSEDFESYDVAMDDSRMLHVPVIDSQTVVNGQGPDLVVPGARYVSGLAHESADKFLWQGKAYFGLETRTIVAFFAAGVETWLTIEYDEPVGAMGIDLMDFDGYGHTTEITVRDSAGAVVDEVSMAIDGAGGRFFGYAHAGIGSVTVTGNALGWSTIIDDHTFGVPAPSGAAVLSLGCFAVARRRRT